MQVNVGLEAGMSGNRACHQRFYTWEVGRRAASKRRKSQEWCPPSPKAKSVHRGPEDRCPGVCMLRLQQATTRLPMKGAQGPAHAPICGQ